MTKKDKQENDLTEGLNENQAKAVTHQGGPLLIVAGAGTGKTTVITRKIAWLIEQGRAKPEEILALTFTDKAATEMEERVDRLLPYGYVGVEVSTFHSFGERVLRDYGLDVGIPADFKLLNQTDSWLLVRQNFDKFDLNYYRPLGNPTRFIHALINHFSRAKDEEVLPEQYLEYAEDMRLNLDSPDFVGTKEEGELEAQRIAEVAKAYEVYQKLLFQNGVLDFGDLIIQTLGLLRKRPNILRKYQKKYKYILVDEFQDTNYAQYCLVKLLSSPLNNITVVADDDQSIYKFRGASFSNIVKFAEEYPQTDQIFLTDNYRSCQNILDLSYQFICQNNPDRLEVQLAERGGKQKLSKKLKSASTEKGLIEHLCFNNQHEEAEAVISKIADAINANPDLTFNDFAILGRSHDSLEIFVEKLDHLKIPYIYVASRGLYHKPVILDIISYFKLLDNYHESTALYRVLNLPVFGIKHRAIVELSHYAKRKLVSLYEALKTAETMEGIDEESLSGFKRLREMLDSHTQLSKDRNVHEVFVKVFGDLQIFKGINPDTPQGLAQIKYIEAFNKKIQNFKSISVDKSLRAFVNLFELESEAGEEGSLEQDLDAGPEAVKVMTVHAAKGLEFHTVFVVGMVDKRFPTIERKDPIELPEALIKDIVPEGNVHLQEERRLFYVAATRAKNELYLTRALDYGGKLTKKPSRFLVELGLAEEEKSEPTGEVSFSGGPEGLHLPVPKSFSFSQISLFRKCPLEYKYRYVFGLPSKGSGNMSFGQTIHKTFEKYLLALKQNQSNKDLFGHTDDNTKLPSYDELLKMYEDSWVDEWYEDEKQKSSYRELGLTMLKNFYSECQVIYPRVKYVEQPFDLKIDGHHFRGKIDRADQTDKGILIIDYKTGNARKIDRVDKDQLLVYQLAAQELYGDAVADLQYWFLPEGLQKQSLLGSEADLQKLKESLSESISQIVECTRNNAFFDVDCRISHDCKYRDLEAR